MSFSKFLLKDAVLYGRSSSPPEKKNKENKTAFTTEFIALCSAKLKLAGKFIKVQPAKEERLTN